ncbi:heart- and neural crest derivatives-expressed protein 2-like [Artemia franciscana]|uniref:BHLH domain-containing protein n=1 Tax=Artemia franciscana TaxID=6661 RepID=A0AA88IC90_ARTSF|nr:hypothetical protein QYM36_000050 [Artemia franciscana]
MSLLTGYPGGMTDEYYYNPGHYEDGHYPATITDHRIQYYTDWGSAYNPFSPDRAGYYSPYKAGLDYESDGNIEYSPKRDFQTEYVQADSYTNEMGVVVPRVRVVKRRNTANKKERRRTLSINSAFSELRDSIPNVPSDTKLSKIKTLRLATSYISYLSRILETSEDASPSGFRADLTRPPRANRSQQAALLKEEIAKSNSPTLKQDQVGCPHVDSTCLKYTNSKGRTGWPQYVWAQELK